MVLKNSPLPSVFSILQPDLIDNRHHQYLLIWGDIPVWMIVDRDVKDLIEFFRTQHSLAEYLNTFSNQNSADFQQIITILMNLKQKGLIRIDQSINKKKQDFRPIIENITINPTNRCNLHCKHCFVHNLANAKDEQLSFHALDQFITDAHHKGYLSNAANIAILGGEPLLRKDLIYEIGNLGRNFKKEVIISTNGLLIDQKFAKKARKLKIVVQVSLDGGKKATHEEIRGSNTFYPTLKNIQLLVKYKVQTLISMVVGRHNYSEISRFYRLGKKLKVNGIRYIPLKMMGGAKNAHLTQIPHVKLFKAIEKLKQDDPQARRLIQRDYHSLMLSLCAHGFPQSHCGAGLRTLVIDADGMLYPCPNHILPEFAIGNINSHTFEELWLQSDRLSTLRSTYHIESNNERCATCCFRYWCLGGCRGETYENTHHLRGSALDCEWNQEVLLESFWTLPKYQHIVKDRREYF